MLSVKAVLKLLVWSSDKKFNLRWYHGKRTLHFNFIGVPDLETGLKSHKPLGYEMKRPDYLRPDADYTFHTSWQGRNVTNNA